MQRLALRCTPDLSLGLTAVGTLASPSASAATGTITGLDGKCLDVTGARSADGTAVQLYDRNGTAPYLHNGWGNPRSPLTVMNATGVKWFAPAFVLSSCSSADELAAAYQKVINAYSLKATDIGLDADAYSNGTVQQRTADAWATTPFDFGGAGQNMGTLTQRAARGLKTALKHAYGYSDDAAYRHMGISSMIGVTDDHETVTTADFRTVLGYAQAHHLARLTCWSANRDRPCPGAYPNDDTCSGVSQSNGQFTGVFARHTG
ncbi:hypothetical protein ACFXPN_46325 [Streptomyces griseorubiginosus]|uniref:hypothetical protein n=1 Tax=Streptomyces griseorubiginosus TaxID=67304 RepID=UPI0036979AA2